MKFQLSPNNCIYLHALMVGIVNHSKRVDIDSGLFRTAHKLKNKLYRASHTVSLSMKERSLIVEMLAYRHTDLVKQNSISEEVEIIESIVTRIRA